MSNLLKHKCVTSKLTRKEKDERKFKSYERKVNINSSLWSISIDRQILICECVCIYIHIYLYY